MAQNSANEGGATGARFTINKGLNRITLGWVETYGQANERLMAEMDTLDSKTKEENKASLDLIRPAIDTKMTAFADKGGTDWTIFLDSLDPSARKLILLSGAANDLQNQLEDVKATAKTEAAVRAILNAQMHKQLITTSGLTKANKRGIAASQLGDVASSVSSQDFRGSSISRAATSENVDEQSRAAKSLGIMNYKENVSAASKGKSEIAKLELAYATASPEKRQAAADAIVNKKREVIDATGGDATGLEGEALDKAYEATIQGADALKQKLIEAANSTETGVARFIDSLSRASQAQSEYNQSVFDNSQAMQNRKKDLEGFKLGGSTVGEIRARQTSIGPSQDARNEFVATSAQLTATGESIVQQQSTGGNIPSQDLENTFAVLQIRAKEQAEAIKLETQARQASIEAIKEEVELEKGRAQTFEDINLALSGGMGKEAKKEAEKQVQGLKRVEEARASGGDAAANAQIGREIDRGNGNRALYTSTMQSGQAESLNQQASLSGSVVARRKLGEGDLANDFTAVGQGRMTRRQGELQNSAQFQTSEINKNDQALLKSQEDSLQLLKTSADIFQGSIKDMTGGLVLFNNELKNIVSSLRDSSIKMKLDSTNVSVDINSGQGLDNFSKTMKLEMHRIIAEQLLAQQQGQV